MYAIRSYYANEYKYMGEPLAAAAPYRQKLSDATLTAYVNGVSVPAHRITSYNVCYTKLLRSWVQCRFDNRHVFHFVGNVVIIENIVEDGKVMFRQAQNHFHIFSALFRIYVDKTFNDRIIGEFDGGRNCCHAGNVHP